MSLRPDGRPAAASLFLRLAHASAAIALVAFTALPAAAQPASSAPVAPAARSTVPSYRMPKLPANVFKVDGRLDEDAWAQVPAIDHFTENLPLAGPQSRHRTELRMAISGHDFYIAVKSWDDTPAEIRAPLVRRDGVLGDQDFVAIYLDSVGTRTFGQFFRLNARGILADGSWNDQIGNEDFSPDFEYEGAAALFDDATGKGWTGEMRIPLTSLRMPDPPPKEWTFIFFNSWTRDTRYRVANVPLPRDWSCMLCIAQAIELPEDMPRATGWSVTPQMTVSKLKDKDSGTTLKDDSKIRAGVDAKWRITGDTIVDATFNPDFSQIEIDAPQLAANTQFALLFPEKRPFFLEGADLFDMPERAVYTRSFTDPKWGARITQRASTRDFTVLATRDEGGGFLLLPSAYSTGFAEQKGADSVVARGRMHFNSTTVGGVATYRRDDDGRTNGVGGIDGIVRLDNDSRLRAQVLGSHTKDTDWRPEAVTGHAAMVEYAHLTSRSEINATLEELSKNFRADQGFIAQNDFRRAYGQYNRKWQDVGPFAEVGSFVNGEHKRTTDGTTLLNAIRVATYANAARNSWYHVEPRYEQVRVAPGGPLHTLRYLHLHYESTPFPWLAYTTWDVDVGERVDVNNDRKGHGAALTGYTRFRFLERIELDVRSNWQWVKTGALGERRRALTERALQVTGVYHFDARNNLRVIAQDGSISRNPELWNDMTVSAKDKTRVLSVVYAYRMGLQMSVYVGASIAKDRDPDSLVDRRTTEGFVKLAYTFFS